MCSYSCAAMGETSSDTVSGPDTSSPVSHTGPSSLKYVLALGCLLFCYY